MTFCVAASPQKRTTRCIEQIMYFVVCVCAAQTVSLAEGVRIRLSNEQNSLKQFPVVSAYPFEYELTIDKHPEIYLLNNQKNSLWRNEPLLLRYHVNPVHVFQPSFIGYRLNYDLLTSAPLDTVFEVQICVDQSHAVPVFVETFTKSYHGTAGPAVVKKDTKRSLYTVVKKDTKRSLHKKETSVPNENGYFCSNWESIDTPLVNITQSGEYNMYLNTRICSSNDTNACSYFPHHHPVRFFASTVSDVISEVHNSPNNSIIVEAITEFTYEIALLVPYANYLNKIGKLKLVRSFKGMECFYHFAQHKFERITPQKRIGTALSVSTKSGINYNMNLGILDYRMWEPPLLRKVLDTTEFHHLRPLVIIHNKATGACKKEATLPSISTSVLSDILDMLQNYTVIYIGHADRSIQSYTIDFDEHHFREEQFTRKEKIPTLAEALVANKELINRHQNVKDFNELIMEYSDYDYNTLQVAIHSVARIMVAVPGGSAMLASYFEGTNIVYPFLVCDNLSQSYDLWRRIGETNIIEAKSAGALVQAINQAIKKWPPFSNNVEL